MGTDWRAGGKGGGKEANEEFQFDTTRENLQVQKDQVTRGPSSCKTDESWPEQRRAKTHHLSISWRLFTCSNQPQRA